MKKQVLSLFLAIVIIVCIIPTVAFADDPTAITIYMSVYNQGKFCMDKNSTVMWNKPVSVEDINGDGKYSLNEALVSAHATYYLEGESGYVTEYNSTYQSDSVITLWGLDTSASGFYRNNAITNAVDQEFVNANDKVTAFVYYDNVAWSDRYSYFDKAEQTVKVGEEFSLTLNYSGYDSTWEPASLPVVGAPIGVYNMTDGSFSVPDTIKGENLFGDFFMKPSTDTNGLVKMRFIEPGTYYVTAQYDSSNYSKYDDALGTVPNYLVPPMCVVTVQDESSTYEATVNTTEDLGYSDDENPEEIYYVCSLVLNSGNGEYEVKIGERVLLWSDERKCYVGVVDKENYDVASNTFSTIEITKSTAVTKLKMYGDVTGDGQINQTDITDFKNYVESGLPLSVRIAADVNFDGKINITDYQRVKAYIELERDILS
ncbi:MAG: dockerin type I repeat-containing protein [Eubacteriales bacterium]|nr:dockerin type I repeat-containing protein [Eubacteriales bacterium]